MGVSHVAGDEADRQRVLRAIKRCLSDAYEFFQEAMDTLDEIGRVPIGAGITPFVGGHLIRSPKEHYRRALIKLDAAERALRPLLTRFRDGRVNASHFTTEEALVRMRDLAEFDFSVLIRLLAERRGRDSVWYRMRELCDLIERVFDDVAED